ncbi:hypothetical protein P0D69_45375 [Paraburkholderia sediminicola]|uniref:hypothetical protein n=1 Tax=Paraburkholderia sediminicola TaxID=458836 RepID=UPI0038BC005A
MKHSDFHIGLEFMGLAGFWWHCTDVGTRTIVAIQLDRDDPNWYLGPPYIAKEMVFDEQEIAACHLTEEEAIKAAIHEHETSGHPGFPNEVVTHMMQVRYKDPDNRYPHKGVLRFDRHRPDGEILHAYAGRKDGKNGLWNCTCRSCGPMGRCESANSSRCRSRRPPMCELALIGNPLRDEWHQPDRLA